MPLKKFKRSRSEAVALTYDVAKDKSPRISAKGRGDVAKNIIKIAKEHNVSIYEDPDLLEILSGLDINAYIPLSMYAVVAEIFSFVYRINDEVKKEE